MKRCHSVHTTQCVEHCARILSNNWQLTNAIASIESLLGKHAYQWTGVAVSVTECPTFQCEYRESAVAILTRMLTPHTCIGKAKHWHSTHTVLHLVPVKMSGAKQNASKIPSQLERAAAARLLTGYNGGGSSSQGEHS